LENKVFRVVRVAMVCLVSTATNFIVGGRREEVLFRKQNKKHKQKAFVVPPPCWEFLPERSHTNR